MNNFGTIGRMSYSTSARTAAILATRDPVRYSFLPYGPKGNLVRDFMQSEWIVSLRPGASHFHMLTIAQPRTDYIVEAQLIGGVDILGE
jgi:hypothetical protein